MFCSCIHTQAHLGAHAELDEALDEALLFDFEDQTPTAATASDRLLAPSSSVRSSDAWQQHRAIARDGSGGQSVWTDDYVMDQVMHHGQMVMHTLTAPLLLLLAAARTASSLLAANSTALVSAASIRWSSYTWQTHRHMYAVVNLDQIHVNPNQGALV